MIKKNHITFDIVCENDANKLNENKFSSNPEKNTEIGDIDELIFPDEYFYISQR